MLFYDAREGDIHVLWCWELSESVSDKNVFMFLVSLKVLVLLFSLRTYPWENFVCGS